MRIPPQTPEMHDMTATTVDVISTSSSTANASPVVLHQTDMLRFKFLPNLVKNEKEPHKSVCGKLLYEKKRKNEDSFPTDNNDASSKVSRGSVKTGDWMEFQLDTSETYELYHGLFQLYALYDNIGDIPYGTATYTRIDNAFRQFLSIIQNDPSAARMIGNEENFDLVKTLLMLITQTESLESLKNSLMELQNENLQHLTTTLNIEKLQRVATLMDDNLDNDSEEFWQTNVFKENQWVLAQIFACPCTIFSDKAYVGGKSIDNTGGNLCDFIYQNRLSQNVALIEIKTPCTEIIGSSYRGTYSFCCPFAFAVRKLRWKGGEKVFNFVLLGMMIPVFCCLIPMFKVFNTLDLRNTYLALILPQVGFSIPIVTYMYRSFMDYVPDSVLESAYIDGATTFQTFMRIVVPMVRNTTVTVLTYRFIYVWNEFTYANTFLTDRAMRTLPITLKDFTGEFGLVEWGPTFAAIVMAVTPTLILYFILSKNVIEGMALGAVKS